MKLVYVIKRFPKISETFVQSEIRELIRQGEKVTICSLQAPHPGEPPHPGAEELARRCVYVPEGPVRFLLLLASSARVLASRPRRAWPALRWCLAWAVRQRRVDHLKRFAEAAYLARRIPHDAQHLHAHFAHGATTVALVLARLTGRPFSFTGHAKDIFQLVVPDLLAAKIAEARFTVAVSEYTREHMCRTLGPREREKVVVVRNGIDRSRFGPRRAEPSGLPTLVSVSRLVQKKGVATLLDACELLARRGVAFRCEVIGDGPLRERLETRAGALSIEDRVALVGARSQDQVRAAYERAAVFVLACQRTRKGDQDGLPVALVEAMAIGVPVVTTRVSGIPEAVEDGRSGLLVPPEDPEALANAIERVLADAGLRGRLVRGGLEAAAGFDLASSVGALRRLFREGPAGSSLERPLRDAPAASS